MELAHVGTSQARKATKQDSDRTGRPTARTVRGVQRALVVGASNDPLEVEADRVAEDVTSLLRRDPSAAVVTSSGAGRIRRTTNPAAVVGAEGGPVDSDTESRIRSARGTGSPLPSQLGRQMQDAFGADFSQVRVHDDPTSHDLNRSIQARAFTTRSDIFLGESAPSLESTGGTKLLAHELTHVVQQTGGAQRSMRVTNAGAPAGEIRRVTAPADLVKAAEQKKVALAEHKSDRAALMSIVRAGAKSSDRRTKNACEWILDGRTKLYALNATGDRADRINHLGESPATTETWFPKGDGGAGDLKDAIAEYNHLDLDDDTNICIDTDDGPATNGWNGDGFIAVMMRGGRMSKKSVLETLRHEVQHDADKNREKEQTAVAIPGDVQANAAAMAKNFEGYKTEYRAYNYEGSSYMKLSPTKVVTKYGFKWTERQLEVFEQIHAGYDHTQEYWDDSFSTATWATANPGEDGPDDPSDKGAYHDGTIAAPWQASIEARRQALVDYVNPDEEGFNKYDSIRVDDFYKALDAVAPGTASNAGKPMSTLMWRTAGLGKKDAQYVLEESPDLRKKMKAHLVDEAYVSVFKLLCEVAGVKKATPLEQLGKSSSKTIQAVSDAVGAVAVGTADPKDPMVRKLRFTTAKLTKAEAKLVLGHEPKLLNKIDRHLAGQARTELLELIEACLG